MDWVECRIENLRIPIKYNKPGEYLAHLINSIVRLNHFYPDYYKRMLEMEKPVIPEEIKRVLYYAMRLPIGCDLRQW
ncbi:MAG: hypothetical protein ACPLXL_01250 [Minisyncoccia bacterium]